MSIGAALGGITGGIYGMSGLAGDGGMDEYQQALDVIKAAKDPKFDFSSVPAPVLQVVAQIDPQTYEARVPDEVKTAVDSPEMRTQQAQAVSKFGRIAQEGLPEDDRLAAMGQQDRVRQSMRQAVEASVQNLRERGQAGGGQEVAMRLGASQQAANLARDSGADLARQAIANKIGALQAGSQLAGQVREQDVDTTQKQAETFNNFKQFVASLQTQAAKDAAAQRASTQQWNATNQQGIANQNTQAKYTTGVENLNRFNNLQSNQANFGLQKAQAVSGALNNLGQAKDAETAAKVAQVTGIGQGIGGIGDSVIDLKKGGGFGLI